ncbi:hypothetical protein AM493_05070 [Flavobacterium akiainvivens]|uniref:Uncharacterized protein n=1 Tax=Flavobacterium akiainvivens TaxID=1202724 RepID=A0A0M9VHE6_9FLAO|nr:hypothetical protein AM493_05070 [Flavobacterium akiainvivens]SFQ32597.1 hypothetical protein SAMN05444144_10348 [Flavobacterium akiainvivens]
MVANVKYLTKNMPNFLLKNYSFANTPLKCPCENKIQNIFNKKRPKNGALIIFYVNYFFVSQRCAKKAQSFAKVFVETGTACFTLCTYLKDCRAPQAPLAMTEREENNVNFENLCALFKRFLNSAALRSE